MRTLKKTLCLVLALVLCFGLASVAFAGNFDGYTDADKIGSQYEEAAAVLIGTGIINGMTETEIGPEGTLTREQAAKIVTYMTLGETLAEVLKADSDPFTDVKATRWSAGYIADCVNEGIIAGYGDGTFGPTDELTGYQFAKMLLVAIGYGDPASYEGKSWTINVSKDAFSAGIFAGDASAATNEPIQRQQAMLMAFNALNYSAKAGTSVYEVKDASGNVLYRGTDALTALVMQQAADGNTLTLVENKTGSLGDTVYGLTKGTATDDFGRESVEYNNGKSGKDKVVYATFAPTAVLTYTTAVTEKALATALGAGNTDANGVKITVITNGTSAAEKTINKATDSDTIGGQGTLVQVYQTGEKTYKVIVVETFVKKLVAGDITKANAATDTDAYITLDGLTYETSAFVAGDVVLYTKTSEKIVNVVKADYAAGKITATAAGYVRVDGVQTYVAAHNIDSVTIGTTAGYKVSNDSYTYYYDSYGNIVAAIAGEVAPVDTKYTYVIATASKAATTVEGGNLFETVDGAAAVAQAKVIDLATGEIKVVNLGVVKGTDNKYYYATATGAASTVEVTDAANANLGTGLMTYAELADGSIVLVAAASTSDVTVQKNSASICVTGVVATSATKLSVVTYTTNASGAIVSASVTTSTGIANFPATATTYKGAIVVANDKGVVSEIIAVVEYVAPTQALNYAIYDGEGETDADGTKLAFYVGGEKVEYYKTGDLDVSTLTKGDVVALTLTDGKVSAAAAQTALAEDVEVTVVDNTFVVAGGTTYYFAETGCEAYKAETNAAVTIAVGDTITVYGSGTTIAFVVVD